MLSAAWRNDEACACSASSLGGNAVLSCPSDSIAVLFRVQSVLDVAKRGEESSLTFARVRRAPAEVRNHQTLESAMQPEKTPI